MIDPDAVDTAKVVGGIIGSVLAGIGIALRWRGWIVRKSSEDGVAIATDAAESTILQRALNQAERERLRADEAFAERNAAVEELGRLRGEVEYLRAQIVSMQADMAVMRQQLNGMRT